MSKPPPRNADVAALSRAADDYRVGKPGAAEAYMTAMLKVVPVVVDQLIEREAHQDGLLKALGEAVRRAEVAESKLGLAEERELSFLADPERQALRELSVKQDMTEQAVIRQALRMYQSVVLGQAMRACLAAGHPSPLGGPAAEGVIGATEGR